MNRGAITARLPSVAAIILCACLAVVIAGPELPKLATVIQDLPKGMGDAVIGGQFVRPFRVWISWREHRIWFTESR